MCPGIGPPVMSVTLPSICAGIGPYVILPSVCAGIVPSGILPRICAGIGPSVYYLVYVPVLARM